MALINFDSINKFTLLFLIVTCTVFSVESQNVPSAIPPALRIKISEYSRSSFYPKDGTSSDSAYVCSALLDSVIPSFLREFLVPGILAELEDEIFANITSETCQRDITYVWSTLMGSVLNSSLPDDFILHSKPVIICNTLGCRTSYSENNWSTLLFQWSIHGVSHPAES